MRWDCDLEKIKTLLLSTSGAVGIDQSTVGLRPVHVSPLLRPHVKPRETDQISTVGLRPCRFGSRILGCWSVSVGTDQISAVGLRRVKELELALVSPDLGTDQISTAGSRLRLLCPKRGTNAQCRRS